MAGRDTSEDKPPNYKVENAIPVLIGHHSVPPSSKSNLSPGFFITHLKTADPLAAPSTTPSPNDRNAEISKEETKKSFNTETRLEQQHLAKLFESVKNNQNFFYTVIASIGIPMALLFVFYFEVSFQPFIFHFFMYLVAKSSTYTSLDTSLAHTTINAGAENVFNYCES